jgi:adenine-specific DNA-methyltransferase
VECSSCYFSRSFSYYLSPIEVCQIIGEWYTDHIDEVRRHERGQFFTPPIVARYMANVAGKLSNQIRVLDPGSGVGVLACAICESALAQKISSLTIIAYESDPVLHVLSSFTLNYTQEYLHEHGIELTFELHQQDFIEAMAAEMTYSSLWTTGTRPQLPFDLTVLNPPYFKVNQKDTRAKLAKDIVQGRTNMYTMFMSLAARALRAGGRFVSITPRSFSSGAYFKRFRQQFFEAITPEFIHMFDSRRSTFEDANVLQENIIISGVRKSIAWVNPSYVTISRCQGLHDLAHPLTQDLERKLIIDDTQNDPLLHLPTSDIDTHLLRVFGRWHNYLATYELEISTGPVVPFRAADMLTSAESVQRGGAVPLLWLHHVHRMNIQWPLEHFDKPQGVCYSTNTKLFVKNATQIILRRFSAKEEPRRITAAVLPETMFDTRIIGLENHLNYLYRPLGNFSYEEAVGLAAFLDFAEFKRHERQIAWETHVWIAEVPEHMIHFNGDKFLRPDDQA